MDITTPYNSLSQGGREKREAYGGPLMAPPASLLANWYLSNQVFGLSLDA